jgi:hypothetical protein
MMRYYPWILIVVLLLPLPLRAQEYFGEYKDALKGEFIEAKPRPKFKLENEFRFSDPNGLLWGVPAKEEVDGASIPQAFWSFIGGPFDGNYIKASVIHDHYCNVKTRTEHDTHRNLYYGMRAAGVEKWRAKFMYWAVATFGPKWTLAKRVVQEHSCHDSGVGMTCKQVSALKVEVAALPAVDLDDPDTLAAALSKASAVARSLRTSDGELLDISASGQVSADLESISNNASMYRRLFINRSFIQRPGELGVLSQWDAGGLEQVKPWQGGKLPTLNESMPLRPSTVGLIEAGKSFTLTPDSIELLQDRIDLKALEMRSYQLR